MENDWIKVTDKLPKPGQRCKVNIVRELIFEGMQEDEQTSWKEDRENVGEFKITGWKPMGNS